SASAVPSLSSRSTATAVPQMSGHALSVEPYLVTGAELAQSVSDDGRYVFLARRALARNGGFGQGLACVIAQGLNLVRRHQHPGRGRGLDGLGLPLGLFALGIIGIST